MTLRTDHVVGALFAAFGLLVLALSGDLPIGTASFPGAGMMPKMLAALLVALGLVLVLRAQESPTFSSLTWQDLPPTRFA